jgi:hypothetical protein
MEPASNSGAASGGGRQLKRWGPIAGVAAVVAIGGGVLLLTNGDDDDAGGATTTAAVVTTAPSDTTAPSESSTPDTTPPDAFQYPLSYSKAVELGIEGDIDWGDRCDTEVGRIAVPDFFAPECYAPFSGDNGGATAQGVTGDEITVVYYEGLEGDPVIRYVTDAIAVTDTNQQQFEMMKEIIRYYETYYETYGRKIKLITFEGTGLATDPVAARADAARIAAEYKPFVVLGGPTLTSAFADELAANKILCISCTPGQPADFYLERDPYVWGLGMSAVQAQTHVVEWVGKQLVGKNAEFAGPDFVDQPRKFGYLYLESSDASTALADQFVQKMADVGAPIVERVPYELNPATLQASAAQAITKMKAAGVTTILFSGDPVAPRDFTKEATAQEYFPEWVNAASGLVDTNAFARTYDPEQWKHAFGITTLSTKTDPTKIGYYALYEWFTGSPPPAPDTIPVIQPSPALFFAVLQQVGPDLTAEHWRDAAFGLSGTQQAISQPYLSYGDKGYWPEADYQGIDDATVFWWDPTAVGPDEIRREGTGMYQFVDGGKRYLPGQWTTDEKLFDPNGAVAIYLTPPPGEEPRQYPSPAG